MTKSQNWALRFDEKMASSKLINVQTKIRPCSWEFSFKINKRACTSIRYAKVVPLTPKVPNSKLFLPIVWRSDCFDEKSNNKNWRLALVDEKIRENSEFEISWKNHVVKSMSLIWKTLLWLYKCTYYIKLKISWIELTQE